MSEVKVNKISPRTNCGTVQLGDSGDTITIPAGATIVNNGTQTGFGRTGTVNWDTTAKTAGFTAVSGNGYFVNTTSGAITVTLPATPSAGDIVGIKDYAGTFGTNNVTVARNGSLIDGTTSDGTLATNQLSVFFVYVDGTQGWKATQSDAGDYGAIFITATGGTIVCCGDYKTHIFTGPGTFCVSCGGNAAGSNTVEYLVVAGGAGGGGCGSGGPGGGYQGAGGGGAGGWRSYSSIACASPLNASAALPITAQAYPITVGAGSAGKNSPNALPADNGSNSVFSTITSAGGGGGGSKNSPAGGASGGSGGGGTGHENSSCSPQLPGGSGNTPPVSPPQGNNGGSGSNGRADGLNGGGGGGGASAVGGSPTTDDGIPGGDGSYIANSFIGPTAPSYGQSPVPLAPNGRYFSGGGGGAASNTPGSVGVGGAGGGGNGGNGGTNGTNGTANTGGGGGGNTACQAGFSGGSGIVMIRYKYQ